MIQNTPRSRSIEDVIDMESIISMELEVEHWKTPYKSEHEDIVAGAFIVLSCGIFLTFFLQDGLPPACIPSGLVCYPVRLTPGQEIKSTLLKFVKSHDIKGGFIMTCCGSVTKATLRFAEKPDGTKNDIKTYNEHFEILSLVGTLSGEDGHLHISLGRDNGEVLGGHVMGDLVVFTTAEIVIGACTNAEFSRPFDENTGYDELCIKGKSH